MPNISRRELLKQTSVVFGASVFGLPLTGLIATKEKLKVVVTGAHPDDPETGCGGLIANLTNAGHEVIIGYLTKGEAGIENTSHEESANIRFLEASRACDILNAVPFFMGQVDGDTRVYKENYNSMQKFLEKERPDVVLTHWPIDTHKDHRACSALTYGAWLNIFPKPDLFFYEVLSGNQTQNFQPTNFVDITSVIEQKHKACMAHKSQLTESDYQAYQGKMEVYRGMESGYKFAEAFVRHWYSPNRIGIL